MKDKVKTLLHKSGGWLSNPKYLLWVGGASTVLGSISIGEGHILYGVMAFLVGVLASVEGWKKC